MRFDCVNTDKFGLDNNWIYIYVERIWHMVFVMWGSHARTHKPSTTLSSPRNHCHAGVNISLNNF